jgi:hypothetical protein
LAGVRAANVDLQIVSCFRFACLLFLNRDPQNDVAVALAVAALDGKKTANESI